MVQSIAGVLEPQTSASVSVARVSPEALPHYLQGLHYLRRDSLSYDLAIPFLQQALVRDPSAALPRVGLADAYLLKFGHIGDRAMLTAAEKILDETAATHRGLPELHATLGNLRRHQGRYDAASQELLLAVNADPSNHRFRRLLAQAYSQTGHDTEASAEFERAIQLQPRHWAGYLSFAVFHHRRGRFQEAATLLERLIGWAPDHAEGLAALGGVYADIARDSDAERVSARACALRPNRTCYLNLGRALQRQGRTEEAITAYERALAFGPPSEQLLVNLADVHAFAGKRTESLDYFRQAVTRTQENLRTNPRNAGSRAILAFCLSQTGDRDRAAFEIQQALHKAPKDKNVQKYGVLTYESIGQREKALEILRAAPKM